MTKPQGYTAEMLLKLSETKARLENYGDNYVIRRKIKLDLAKTKNYKEGVFYHATGGLSESGVGKGLYLGKDKKALDNFYNSDGTEGEIIEYVGAPKYLDLTLYKDMEEFEKRAIEKYSKREDNEHLKLLMLELGFDGIRYYDPIATGEEFVLYNTDKVKAIDRKKRRETRKNATKRHKTRSGLTLFKCLYVFEKAGIELRDEIDQKMDSSKNNQVNFL